MPEPEESQENKSKNTIIIKDRNPPQKKDNFAKFEQGSSEKRGDAFKGRKLTELKFTAKFKSSVGNQVVKTINVVEKVKYTTYHIYWNSETEGKIEKHIPKEITAGYENKYAYVYHDKEGKEHEICMVDKFISQKWIKGSKYDGGKGWEKRIVEGVVRYYQKDLGTIELIKMPLPLNYTDGKLIIKLSDNTNRKYINPKSFATIIGALADCNYLDVTMNGFTSKDGTGAPSVSHINGVAGDLRYLRTDKSGESLYIDRNPNLLDIVRQEKLIDALIKFGYKSFLSYSITIKGKPFLLKNSTHLSNHEHHLHVNRQNYSPNYKEIDEN